MPRELNKELFAGTLPASQSTDLVSNHPSEDVKRHDILLREMALELARLKRHIKDVEVKADTNANRLNDWARGTKNTLERLQSGQQRLEQLAKAAVQELKSKISTLAGKFTERKGVDSKVQELIDRHNQALLSFEARMNQMQKIISEQELKILAYQSALKEMQKRF